MKKYIFLFCLTSIPSLLSMSISSDSLTDEEWRTAWSECQNRVPSYPAQLQIIQENKKDKKHLKNVFLDYYWGWIEKKKAWPYTNIGQMESYICRMENQEYAGCPFLVHAVALSYCNPFFLYTAGKQSHHHVPLLVGAVLKELLECIRVAVKAKYILHTSSGPIDGELHIDRVMTDYMEGKNMCITDIIGVHKLYQAVCTDMFAIKKEEPKKIFEQLHYLKPLVHFFPWNLPCQTQCVPQLNSCAIETIELDGEYKEEKAPLFPASEGTVRSIGKTKGNEVSLPKKIK